MIDNRPVRVALLGAGSVGSQVAQLVIEHRSELASRIGADIELIGIAVRNPDARRDVDLPQALLTTDADRLVMSADIVVELMGGVEPARTLLLAAIEAGADIVTGNKTLLAVHGPELFAAAEQVGAQISYEAAVGGAIPLVRPLRESLAGDRVDRILGIVNGTTNYILDRMDRTGDSLADALAAATDLGYAEADPTADIGGHDAAQKAAILARLAFHTTVPLEAVHCEGITDITAELVAAARQSGQVVKLLAICERVSDTDTGAPGVIARVHPSLIPRDHPLAAVHGANNAVFVEAAAAGSLMFYGAGAGGVQTASAVLGDIVATARRHVLGGPGLTESFHAALPVLPIGQADTRYAITLEVVDQTGVLAQVAQVFAAHAVSVEEVQQRVAAPTNRATLVVGTHRAREQALRATVSALAVSPVVHRVVSVLRSEGAA